jgi:predicted aldo/keto reductase-like oxidoreductase
MFYRTLGKTGMEVSAIGMGMEHFHPAPENIAPALHRAMDLGINYVDLMIWAPQVKDAFSAALKGRRDKVILANHLGAAVTKDKYRRTRDVAECEEVFHDWLRRMGTDFVDVLLITYLDAPRDYTQVVEGGVMELAQRLKREGKARAIGLSGHHPSTTMRAIRDGYMDVVMQPVHVANSNDRERDEMLALCAEQGIGVVAMKPFAGGDMLKYNAAATPAKCLHYTLSQPGVSVALMGVKNVEELETNIAYLTATDAEKDYSEAAVVCQGWQAGNCTYCNHCQPCPAEIDIASVLRLLFTAEIQGGFPDLKADYASLPVLASDCTECGLCEERCPFGVQVIAKMQKAVELLES